MWFAHIILFICDCAMFYVYYITDAFWRHPGLIGFVLGGSLVANLLLGLSWFKNQTPGWEKLRGISETMQTLARLLKKSSSKYYQGLVICSCPTESEGCWTILKKNNRLWLSNWHIKNDMTQFFPIVQWFLSVFFHFCLVT